MAEVHSEVSGDEESPSSERKESAAVPVLAERSLDDILDGLLPTDAAVPVSNDLAPFSTSPVVSGESSTWVAREVPLPTLQVSEAGQRSREEGPSRRSLSIEGVSRRESHDLRDCLDEEDSPVMGLGGVLGRFFNSSE
jgi:hypothetical protein